MNIVEKIKNKMSWVDKLGITMVAVTLIGCVIHRLGFQLVGNTIFGICFGVVVVCIVYFAYKVIIAKEREKR